MYSSTGHGFNSRLFTYDFKIFRPFVCFSNDATSPSGVYKMYVIAIPIGLSSVVLKPADI